MTDFLTELNSDQLFVPDVYFLVFCSSTLFSWLLLLNDFLQRRSLRIIVKLNEHNNFASFWKFLLMSRSWLYFYDIFVIYQNIFLVLVFMEPFYAIMREFSEAILIQTEKFYFFSKTDSCFRKFWEMYLSEFMTISFSKHAYSVSALNPFMTEVPIIKKPVHWFAGEFKRGRRS